LSDVRNEEDWKKNQELYAYLNPTEKSTLLASKKYIWIALEELMKKASSLKMENVFANHLSGILLELSSFLDSYHTSARVANKEITTIMENNHSKKELLYFLESHHVYFEDEYLIMQHMLQFLSSCKGSMEVLYKKYLEEKLGVDYDYDEEDEDEDISNEDDKLDEMELEQLEETKRFLNKFKESGLL
jgi:hypothetical protein